MISYDTILKYYYTTLLFCIRTDYDYTDQGAPTDPMTLGPSHRHPEASALLRPARWAGPGAAGKASRASPEHPLPQRSLGLDWGGGAGSQQGQFYRARRFRNIKVGTIADYIQLHSTDLN